ncbi:MAG: glycosyltransferase family 9 protein [Chloroflexota bacterium]|nr:glycosyltransferase family 9 protein [Dehalococcoidia bacterium]MDW8252564.1 glycosyltransferase family 9 protein [Chloroflexota bacterium]
MTTNLCSTAGCLVVRLGAIGDTLLTLPALRALRRRYRRVVMVGSAAASALLGAVVDQVVEVEAPAAAALFRSDAGADHLFRAVVGPIEAAVVWLNRPREVAAALQRIGIRHLVTAPSVPADRRHVVDHLLSSIGEPTGAIVELPVAPSDRARAAALLRERGVRPDSVVLALGAGSPSKRWPVDRFAALAARLGRPAVALSGPAEGDAAARLRQLRPDVPILDNIELALLPAVLAHGAVVVANDSGPAHLAAAVGTPVVVLFGPTDPAVWAPRGKRVVVLQAGDGRLESLEVEAVSSAVTRLLAAR